MKKSPTYYKVLELHGIGLGSAITKKVTYEQSDGMGYERQTITAEQKYIPEEVTIVQSHFMLELSARAVKLVQRMIAELQYNNMLWYFDHRGNTRDSRAITELRKRGVLLTTEDITIHLVNPEFIRRGSRQAVLAHTIQMLAGVPRVNRDLIKPLKTNSRISFSQMDKLTGPEQTPDV